MKRYFFFAGIVTVRRSTVVVEGCVFAYPGLTMRPVLASRGMTIVFVVFMAEIPFVEASHPRKHFASM